MKKVAILTGLVMALGASTALAAPAQKATGGIHFLSAGTFPTHVAFNAQPTDDGAKGQVELRGTEPDGSLWQRFHGIVDCYDQVGSTAMMTGEVTQLELGTNTNQAMFFQIRVTDNGEGKNAAPDTINFVRRATPFSSCEATLATQPVVGGNLKVHG